MKDVNLEEAVRSDAKLSTSLNTLQDLQSGSSEEEIRNFALTHPSLKEFKKNGRLPEEFYDAIKRNSEYVASDPRFRRALSNGSISDIEAHTRGDNVRAKNLIYDSTPGRFYPYKEALKEGGKALLKLSPFLLGGYFLNKSLRSPISHIASGTGLLKYLIPGFGPISLAKDVAKTGLKLGPSLLWSTIKAPLMYLGGIYILYKTVKGFLKSRKEKKEREFASRERLEDLALQLGECQRYLEDDLMRNGAMAGAT